MGNMIQEGDSQDPYDPFGSQRRPRSRNARGEDDGQEEKNGQGEALGDEKEQEGIESERKQMMEEMHPLKNRKIQQVLPVLDYFRLIKLEAEHVYEVLGPHPNQEPTPSDTHDDVN